MNTLYDKGFDKANPNHILILCGDLFDRGTESVKLFNLVKELDDRFIYVRGNHEDLLEDCLREMERHLSVSSHHKSNGTLDTINQFLFEEYGNDYNQLKFEAFNTYFNSNNTDRTKLDTFFKPIHNVVDWINKKSINYFELGDYIFVHGWIPKKPYDNTSYYYFGIGREGGKYYEDWRKADTDSWNQARWLNGMEECIRYGVKEVKKTIVCGHWHCSWYWSHIKQQHEEFPPKNRLDWELSFQPAFFDGGIAIDACTAYSNLVNILVFDEVEKNSIKLKQN